MMFATMNMTKRDGTEMSKGDTDQLAFQWQEVIIHFVQLSEVIDS